MLKLALFLFLLKQLSKVFMLKFLLEGLEIGEPYDGLFEKLLLVLLVDELASRSGTILKGCVSVIAESS